MQNDDDLALLLRQRALISRLQKHAREEKIPVIGKNTGYFLESAVKLAGPSSVLEIGCGNGFSSYFIVKKHGQRVKIYRNRYEQSGGCQMPGNSLILSSPAHPVIL